MKMRLISAAAMLGITMLASQMTAQEVTSLNVVGFQKVQITGGASDTFSLISIPMTKLPVDRGVITGNSSTTITVTGAGWTPGQFAAGVASQESTGNSTFYIEVSDTNNAFEGRYWYITNNTADTLTLVAAEPQFTVGNELQGASYKIIPANRVRDIFGEPGTQVLLGSGSTAGADLIYGWSSGWQTPIFFKTAGLGTTNHWMQGSTVVDNMVIHRDTGLLVLRRAASGGTTNIVVQGEVSGNIQSIVIPGSTSFSVIGGGSAIDVPIGQAGLKPPVLTGGPSTASADLIYPWNNGWQTPIFFKTSGLGVTNCFVQGGVNVDSTFKLEAGKSYLVLRRSTSTAWDRPSPLTP